MCCCDIIFQFKIRIDCLRASFIAMFFYFIWKFTNWWKRNEENNKIDSVAFLQCDMNTHEHFLTELHSNFHQDFQNKRHNPTYSKEMLLISHHSFNGLTPPAPHNRFFNTRFPLIGIMVLVKNKRGGVCRTTSNKYRTCQYAKVLSNFFLCH